MKLYGGYPWRGRRTRVHYKKTTREMFSFSAQPLAVYFIIRPWLPMKRPGHEHFFFFFLLQLIAQRQNRIVRVVLDRISHSLTPDLLAGRFPGAHV